MREFLSTLPQVISAKAGPRAGAGVTARLVDVTRRLFEAARDAPGRRDALFLGGEQPRTKSYTVQPYRLALAQGGVYLVAWVPAYDEFRTFAVERVERLSVAEETFKKTRELPADLFRASMGVFWGEPERIELEFEPRVALFVRSRSGTSRRSSRSCPTAACA